jgi:5'-3' exonuclease
MYRPKRLVACLDGDWRPSWRVELFPDYKANRLEEDGEGEEEPDLLTPQIPILLDIIEAFGIPVVGVDDYEADDVMATYAVNEPGPIRIVTGDRDLFQLVSDQPDVQVIYLAKGISQHDLVNLDWISKKYQIPGDRYGLFATFRGDPSDGLPGVKGIGEKGAALIARHYEDAQSAIAGALADHEHLTPALRKKIIEGREYLSFAPKLVSCATNVPLPKIDLSMPKKPKSMDTIMELKEQYNLGASIDRMISALNW